MNVHEFLDKVAGVPLLGALPKGLRKALGDKLRTLPTKSRKNLLSNPGVLDDVVIAKLVAARHGKSLPPETLAHVKDIGRSSEVAAAIPQFKGKEIIPNVDYTKHTLQFGMDPKNYSAAKYLGRLSTAAGKADALDLGKLKTLVGSRVAKG